MPSLEELESQEPRRTFVRDLKTIQTALDFENYPRSLVNVTKSVRVIDYHKYPDFTPTGRTSTFIGRFFDGAVILWATQRILGDQSHRLIVPECGNDFAYHSYRYNFLLSDMRPEEPVDLTGIEAMASKNQINVDIARLCGQITTISALEWDRVETIRSSQHDIFTII